MALVWFPLERYEPSQDALLKKYGCQLSDHNLTNYFLWSHARDYSFAEMNGALCVRAKQGERMNFYFPFGEASKEMIEALLEEGKVLACPWGFANVSIEQKAFLEAHFPGKFSFEAKRDAYDYVYSVSDLIALQGTAYRRVRNHLNQFFERYPNAEYCSLTVENIPEALDFYTRWLHSRADQSSLQNEFLGTKKFLAMLPGTACKGGLLKVDGQVVAFTLGEALNEETVVIHLEKADTAFHGAYQAINQIFLAKEWAHFKYVNREPDMGVEGLRKAKLSYRPCALLEKYEVS